MPNHEYGFRIGALGDTIEAAQSEYRRKFSERMERNPGFKYWKLRPVTTERRDGGFFIEAKIAVHRHEQPHLDAVANDGLEET